MLLEVSQKMILDFDLSNYWNIFFLLKLNNWMILNYLIFFIEILKHLLENDFYKTKMKNYFQCFLIHLKGCWKVRFVKVRFYQNLLINRGLYYHSLSFFYSLKLLKIWIYFLWGFFGYLKFLLTYFKELLILSNYNLNSDFK